MADTITRIKRILLSSVLATLLIFSAATSALAASEKWEYYSTGVDSQVLVWGSNWSSQTFTVGTESHSITSVRLLMYRIDSPGTVTVSIRDTSAGVPTGSDLAWGTIDGDLFTTDTNGSWYEIPVTEYSLEAGTQYAVVVRAVSGTGTGDTAAWKIDGSSASMADGSEALSTNGGITWADDADDDYYFEVWGESLIDISRCEVYRSFLEDDDLLIVGQYINIYAPYYPQYDPSRYFDIQLRSTDGATVIAQTVCKAWGNKPCSIYLSADQAAGISSGTAYRIYISEVSGTPATYYTLTTADWRGDDMSNLKSWVITAAYILENYYNVDFTDYVAEKGIVLNEEGGVIFEAGIPGLSSVIPEAFQVIVTSEDITTTTWTNSFEGSATYTDLLGVKIAGYLDNIGGLFGADGGEAGGFVILAIYIIIAIFMVGKTNIIAAFAIGFPVLILGAWLHLLPIALIGVVLAIIVLLFVWYMFWSRT
jgi:hypothetical protein